MDEIIKGVIAGRKAVGLLEEAKTSTTALFHKDKDVEELNAL